MFTRVLGIVGLVLALAAQSVEGRAAGMPDLKGWRRAGTLESYNRKSVWQAINGAAELFLSYGLQSLRQQAYEKGGKGGLAVTAQLYRQGSALDAFGVFARERPPKATALEVGAGSVFATGGHCLAHKGVTYVKIVTTRGTLSRDACRLMLEGLTRALPGGEPPSELGWLPAQRRIAASEGYTRSSYLGTRRLRNCVHADYATHRGRRYKLFVMLPRTKTKASALWRELSRHWKQRTHAGQEVITTQLPYRGSVVLVRRSEVILGAVGVGDLKTTVALLRGLKGPRTKGK